MLISFAVSNSRSFKGEAGLSLRREKRKKNSTQPWDSWEPYSPVACVYGANASGKSNFFSALYYLRDAVRDSHSSWAPDEGTRRPAPFLLGESVANSVFELEFEHEGQVYQYGFEADSSRFVGEWLYSKGPGARRTLFERSGVNGDEWYFGPSLKGRLRTISELTRANSLFLSCAASNNHELLSEVYSWISTRIVFLSPGEFQARLRLTASRLRESESFRDSVLGLLEAADLGINGVRLDMPEVDEAQVEEFKEFLVSQRGADPDSLPTEQIREALALFDLKILLKHVGAGGTTVPLPLSEESMGTQTLLGIAGPVIDAIEHGGVLVVDELDTSLHPVLVRAVVNLFKSKASNIASGQLVFSSHDVSLLMQDMFGDPLLDNDQIWFVEKTAEGESVLYPLTDFKVRPNHSLLRGYLQGRYGAVPKVDWRSIADAMVRADA